MDNGGKNEAFFTGLLNKTRKDKIFIVILAGILMMVIAMPTKSSSAKSYTTGPVISTGSEDYEKNLGEELQQMLENTDGVGKVKVLVKTNDTKEVTGVLVVCEGGDDKNLVAYITDAINGLLGVPVHKIKVMKMLAAAGYINYAGDLDNIIKVKDKEKAAAVVADNVSTDSNEAEAADTDFTDEPGTVILTSAGVKSEAVAAAKLNREQVRASSIENLKSIADDAGIAEDAKKAAVEQLAKLENNADKETAIELLLSAKGFDSSVVTVSDTNVDAVINVSELSDTDKAQIEDIIKRKTGFAADKITINICNN